MGEPDSEPVALSIQGVLGMHGPWTDLATQDTLLPNGWLVDILYSTDELWSADSRWNQAASSGHRVALRVDYARGSTVPPNGGDGCIEGFDGQVGQGGSHRECYVEALGIIVGNNHAVHDWIIGNEPNLYLEGEGFPDQVIDAQHFAEVYVEAREAIRAVPGHEDDVVMLGGVSPGPVVPGLRHEDGVTYLLQMLEHLDPLATEGVAIHAYGGWPVLEDNGGQAAIDVFDHAWQSQLEAIDQAGFGCSTVLLSEFNASYHHGVPGSNGAHPDASAGAAFIDDAVGSVEAWNNAGGHPIAGMVWFTWMGGQWPQYKMDDWWAHASESTATASNNWALALQSRGDVPGVAPSPSCAQTELPCPCEPGFDNVCFYAPEYAGCRARLGVEQACNTGDDWARGWHLYNDANAEGFVCGAPPPSPSCSCAQGRYHNGEIIPTELTYCGFSVCGMDDNVYTCGEGDVWVQTGQTCGARECQCAHGRHQDGTLIDADNTECGFRVCGMSDTWWSCEPQGWVESPQTACSMD